MKTDWPETSLGDECDLLTGFPFKSAQYTDDPGGIRLVRGDNVVQGRLRWDAVKRWPANATNGLEQYQLQQNDVVLAMDRPWIEAGLKYSAISTHDLPALLVQRVSRLRGGSTLDTRFLKYLVGSAEFTNHVLSVQTGTAIPHISAQQIKSFTFQRPPVSAQRRIADILGTLDDKIELNRRMNETLEAMARRLFKSWFVDFDPVHAKAALRRQHPKLSNADLSRRALTNLDPKIAELFPDSFEDSAIGRVPMGWPIARLCEHTEAQKGLSYKGSGLSDAGLPLHNLNSVLEGGGYKFEGIKFYTSEFKERHLVHPGEVIVANTEQGHDCLLLGHAAIIPDSFGDEGLFSHHVYRLRIRAGSLLKPDFLCRLLNSQRVHDLVSGYGNGTTVNMLPIDGVEQPQFAVPPQKFILAFDGLAANVRAREIRFVDENRRLAKTRDLLLPRLLAGQLTI